MDASQFTDAATGRLMAITHPIRDWAFIPQELPPSWEFPAELWPLLADAKEALGTLNGIGQTLPNPELLLRPLQSREAVTSSRIEGTFVSPEQLLLYELDPRDPREGDHQAEDWREVLNYSRALRHGCVLLESLPVCNRLIREMHGILMEGARGQSKAPGELRTCQVQIGSRARFVPPLPQAVQPRMTNLERYINELHDRMDPLVRSFIVHYQFEAIHPFRDGNGRVGRALLALMIYHELRHSMPWLYLSAYFEEFKDEYVENFLQVSASGAWTQWIEFCLRGTIRQANDSIHRCHLLKALREKFFLRITDHSARTHRIIESLFASPVVTVISLSKAFEVWYRTAKADIDRLVAAGILTELVGTHPKSFYAQEIYNIAYGDVGDVRTEPGKIGEAEKNPPNP